MLQREKSQVGAPKSCREDLIQQLTPPPPLGSSTNQSLAFIQPPMTTATRISLLDQDVVHRRRSVRSLVGRAWGRLHRALGATTPVSGSVENDEDEDFWMGMNNDEDPEHAGYTAIDEEPVALSLAKPLNSSTASGSQEQENLYAPNRFSSELEEYHNSYSSARWSRNLSITHLERKQSATQIKRGPASGYVAFA